ncbi:SRPBCC domain-containing protein [Actinomycetaceae bacterium L2_0104]
MTNHEHPDRVEYRAEHVYELPASPEQVWDAIATAEGISSWMVPTRLDPRVGGNVSFDLGDFMSTGVVIDYRPNERFAYEEPWPIAERAEDVPPRMIAWFDSIGVSLSEVHEGLAQTTPIATEFLIDAISGGTCVLRIVTSAFGSGADWENEFFSEMDISTIPIWDRLAARFTT